MDGKGNLLSRFLRRFSERVESAPAQIATPKNSENLLTPSDYSSWWTYEVVFPLAAGPLFVFFALCFISLRSPTWQGVADAIIGVAGSGDLLIYSAFLLINVSSKYRASEDGRKLSANISDGEIRSGGIQWKGTILLLVFAMTRISVARDGLPQDIQTAQFIIAGTSTIVLFFVLFWATRLVFNFHISEAIRRLERTHLAVQYNKP